MKHLSVRPAAAKLMISCEAFVAAAVLGVVLFLNFYHSYNDGILSVSYTHLTLPTT